MKTDTKENLKEKQIKKQQGLCGMICHVIYLELKHCPVICIISILLTIGTGVCTAANVFFKQNFYDSVEAMAQGRTTIPFALASGIVMTLFLVFTLALQTVSELVQNNVSRIAAGHMGRLLNEKASRIDPIVYEDNHFLDHINKAYVGIEAAVSVADSAQIIGLVELSYFIYMGCYFFSLKPILLLMFCISFLPAVIGAVVRRNMYGKLENQAAPYRRKYEYFEKCLCSREYVKETRLWRGERYFKKLYERNLGIFTQLKWKTTMKVERVELALRFLLLTGYVGTVICMFCCMVQGEIGIGAFAAVFSSLDQMFGRMENVFHLRVGSINRNFGAAQNYYAFLKLREREGKDKIPLKREVIELKNVCFRYPDSTEMALDSINLTIRKGETIAVVGVNGSGKSTLTRLLTGLYLPTAGSLTIDGKETVGIAPETLYRNVSAVFQRYQSYKMTVAENVIISDMGKEKQGLQVEGETVESALGKAAFPFESVKLTEGIGTMLGKDFGGTDLSGGQWQRLANARGLYRNHEMIILDEPTAAIDPLEEAAIYRSFAEISKEKTAIIVTHRLGSAQIADRIIVMDAGHIVDIGTHEDLLRREGKYREMYHAQAKWYV